MVITKSNKKSSNHKDFLVPPNAILKYAHTLGSQFLTQISTKLERKRKGKRWIFNLSYKSWLKPWEREERMNPSS
jgi:hypothetical protein